MSFGRFQLLREFQRHKELIKRPTISNELVTERETLLGQLTVLIKQIQDDFNQRASGAKDTPKGKNLPEVVNAIVWVRQLEAKVSMQKNSWYLSKHTDGWIGWALW